MFRRLAVLLAVGNSALTLTFGFWADGHAIGLDLLNPAPGISIAFPIGLERLLFLSMAPNVLTIESLRLVSLWANRGEATSSAYWMWIALSTVAVFPQTLLYCWGVRGYCRWRQRRKHAADAAD